MILEHLDKNNLHHAYLIEGDPDQVVPEILKFCEILNVKTFGNPDFSHISIDSFKIEDARNLKSYATEKGFSLQKKVFIISTNSFLLDAQNVLLKIFEEPIENTLFFLIVPDTSALLKTLVSRFYFISTRQNLAEESEAAAKFIAMPLKNRIDFIKELIAEPEEESEIISADSARSKALKFLNVLESTLHQKMSRGTLDIRFFEHVFKVREFLRMPGSSTKNLMESVALVTPTF